jgi:hypothetical protein
MEKVQNLKSSNTAPSSKTFRDEKLKVAKLVNKFFAFYRIRKIVTMFTNLGPKIVYPD